jgi:hypothetical protein
MKLEMDDMYNVLLIMEMITNDKYTRFTLENVCDELSMDYDDNLEYCTEIIRFIGNKLGHCVNYSTDETKPHEEYFIEHV